MHFLLSLDIIIIALLGIEGVEHFTDLIKAQVNVIVDDLEVINASENNTKIDVSDFDPYCQLTLHRTLCANPPINQVETIGWNTRICFSWKCSNTTNYVMRVENCWTGSSHNPIYLIDENGCSLEKTMIKTPRYEPSLLESYSIGWLSVRLVGVHHIRLSCQIRMCHLCDKKCPLLTPPKKCQDEPEIWKLQSIWNQTEEIRHLCDPVVLTNSLKSKAAAPTYCDSIWLVPVVIVAKLLLF